MNIMPSITERPAPSKQRRDSLQTTLLGGEFARKFKGGSEIGRLHTDHDFAAGFIGFGEPVRAPDVAEHANALVAAVD
jgi:hypothetical protein